MNLIPHVEGAEEAFSIGCLHELRGTIGSIADSVLAGGARTVHADVAA